MTEVTEIDSVQEFELPVYDGLCATAVTKDYLEEKLQTALHTDAQFGPNFTAEQIGVNQGFLSIIVRILCDWQSVKENDQEEKNPVRMLPETLVVKIPTLRTMFEMGRKTGWTDRMMEADESFDMESHMDAFQTLLNMGHNSEAAFYTLVNEEQLPLLVPKCYLAVPYPDNKNNKKEEKSVNFDETSDQQPMIVMEDLSAKAAVKPLYEGIPYESLKIVFENLATVHAYSLKNDDWKRNPRLKTTFARMQEAFKSQLDEMNKVMLRMLKKDYPDYFDPMIDRMFDLLDKYLDFKQIDTMHEKLQLPQVLTHGDLWMNNLLWQKAEDGTETTTDNLLAIVDWQICHAGCIGEDFVRIMCSSVAPDIRRERLGDLVGHYLCKLRQLMGEDEELPFSRGDILSAYRQMFPFGAFLIIPAMGAFVMQSFGFLGDQDIENRRRHILNQTKCLIEDVYAIEDSLS